MDIGNLITQHRTRQNLSMNVLAKNADVSQSTISDIEAGKRQPTFDVIEKIACALGLSISEFFSEESEYKISASYNRLARLAEEKKIPIDLLEEAIIFIEKAIHTSSEK